METLDSRGTPEPAGSYPPGESISTRAIACESAFIKGLCLLDSSQEDGLYATALRKLQKRFTNWTGYLGVFAGGNGSLDQRLKRYPQHSDLVVVALNMLKDNLLQITAEPSDQGSDDSSDEETDRREVELEGIRMSINELDRLAIHIRQSSTSSLDARVKAFASKRATEISSFETKAMLAVNALYPDAPESLRQHLSKSMVHRYTKLLYWKSHDRKLRADNRPLGHSRKLYIDRTPSPLPLKAVPQQQTAIGGSDTRPELVARPGSAGISLLSDTFASDPVSRFTLLPKPVEPVKQRAGATTVLETGALFPKPPKFDDGDETAPCPLCRKVFQGGDFTNDVWWKSHVNEDLVPFVCVATSCLDSPCFARRSAWRAHIEQDHGTIWQQNTGIPLHGENETNSPDSQGACDNTPICPLCCSSPLEDRAKRPQTSSESPEEPRSVSKEPSDGVFGKKAVRFDVPEQEESPADQGSPIIPKSETKPTRHMMMNHIAGHLQFLALLTPRLSTKNLADGEDIDFASSQGPSGDSNSGERSTLGDEFEHKEGQETWSIDIQEPTSGTNPVQVPEESIAPQDEDIPPTELMDWALFSPLDPPHEEEEDKVKKHIRESLLKDAANRFAKADLPKEASEAAETVARLLPQSDSSSDFSSPIRFEENLTRDSVFQFFTTSLSSVDDGIYATLADYCTEEVWERTFDPWGKLRQGNPVSRPSSPTGSLSSLQVHYSDRRRGEFIKPSSDPWLEPPTPAGNIGLGPQVHNALETQDQGTEAHQIDMDQELMQHLSATDLGVVKAQFEDSADSLPRGVCSWIFDDVRFRKFLADPQPQMLWIHGITGTGKTMLLCAIIDELREATGKAISYSILPGTNSDIGSATAVVHELIHHLVVQRPWLLKYVREIYELSGKAPYGDLTSWEDFFDVLRIILGHPSMANPVFIIDDICERTTEVGTLLGLITHKLQIPCKWILSSRSGMYIMDLWEQGDFEEIDLNLARSEILQAINAYANYRVESLAARKHYEDSLRRNIHDYLVSNADGNFLWMSMACRDLEHTSPEDILKSSIWLPPSLSSHYDKIYSAILRSRHGHYCEELLATVAVSYHHQTVAELSTLVRLLTGDYLSNDDDDMKNFITFECGFFLGIRGNTVDFIHKSARNYVYSKLRSSEIASQHKRIFKTSLASLSRVFRRDMSVIDFQEQSYSSPRRWNVDPLARVRYTAIYWINHFVAHIHSGEESTPEDLTSVLTFLRTVGLYWLEAQILIQGSVNIPGLESLIELLGADESTPFKDLRHLVRDLIRLSTVFKPAFQVSPMQLYASALVFSPIESPVMQYFKGDAPDWLAWHTIIHSSLDSSEFTVLELAPDASLLATVSGDSVNIQDMRTLKITLQSEGEAVSSFAFSHQRLLAFGTHTGTVLIWDIAIREISFEFLRDDESGIASLAFSSDGDLLVLVTFTGTIEIWDLPSLTLCWRFSSTQRLTSRSLNNRSASLFVMDLEALSIDSPELAKAALAALKADHHVGFELSDDGDWITKDGKQVVWLPPEFQASRYAVAGNVVVISCQSGLLRFDFK
ncbi:hypothetical protein BHE90_003557 [Fusarium euwallaceae]|uniref:Nephrocystin 3-like N-terminal domain-containing protein n=1 Tax=Fusarium euwallaceae TaxID=1147111 RepID=A0A430M1Z0_9HYPO|nr:hypothetical protein BHE90_003557 [Fusarium euwallaceae]